MDVGTVANDEGELVDTTPEKQDAQELVAVDNDSDQHVIRHSLTQATKHWESCDGGLGCFSRANRQILQAIASVTGTNITINEDLRRIKVSGRNTGDVDDALAKLSRIEAPLVSLLAPLARGLPELTPCSQSRGIYAPPT